MALVLAERVRETCSSPGTGTVTLLGAVTGYQSFAAVGNGNTTYYTIADQSGANWEVGIGTYTSAGTTLARTTVLASSNAGATVNFSSGVQDVFLTYPASRSAYVNGTTVTFANSGNIPVTALNSGTSASSSTFWRGDGTWATAGATPAGSTTQVQYNSGGAFAGSANLTFDGTNLTCGGSVTANSDETLKTNWRGFSDDFVEQLAKVKHGTYDRLDQPLTQEGVSAQSLQSVLPHSVLKGEDGKLSVAYGNAALVAAIKLAERVVQLEAIVAKLTEGK